MFGSKVVTSCLLASVVTFIAPCALSAESSVDAGKALAVKDCTQCHTLGKGEPPGAGPNLYGIVGRPAGKTLGFTYSPDFLKVMSGKTWDVELLDKWLTDTQAVVAGTGMTYFQNDPKIRKKVISYLVSLR